jgi:hypothetical protein
VEGHPIHPLVAVGSTISGLGAITSEYAPMLVGFLLTLLGIYLQRCEHKRHERAMGANRETR